MSVLAHVCRRCGHDVGWHSPREAGYTSCTCCRAGRPDEDPEPCLRETWTASGEPEPLWRPGTVRNHGTAHSTRVCGCAACRRAADGLNDG